MLGLQPKLTSESVFFCLGAHCDDKEIGCAEALLELAGRYSDLRFRWVVFSRAEEREAETCSAAARLLGCEPRCQVEAHRVRGSYFPYCGY